MSACERLALVFLLFSPLLSACGAGDTCVRNSDCRDGLGCNDGRCAVVLPPPPKDASTDAPDANGAVDAGADRDSAIIDGSEPVDAADASVDAPTESDTGPEVDAADAADDVTDAGSESTD
jgi:hypothetical protein